MNCLKRNYFCRGDVILSNRLLSSGCVETELFLVLERSQNVLRIRSFKDFEDLEILGNKSIKMYEEQMLLYSKNYPNLLTVIFTQNNVHV